MAHTDDPRLRLLYLVTGGIYDRLEFTLDRELQPGLVLLGERCSTLKVRIEPRAFEVDDMAEQRVAAAAERNGVTLQRVELRRGKVRYPVIVDAGDRWDPTRYH